MIALGGGHLARTYPRARRVGFSELMGTASALAIVALPVCHCRNDQLLKDGEINVTQRPKV